MGEAVNLDDPGPDDIAAAKLVLVGRGEPVETMTDEEIIARVRGLLGDAIPRPVEPLGSGPVNGRVWLHDALTSGGFKQPEDEHLRADLGDGGDTVHLAVLGILVMRHMSGAAPPGWSDEDLSANTGMPVEDLRRGQILLDDVATSTGREATPSPRWWQSS